MRLYRMAKRDFSLGTDSSRFAAEGVGFEPTEARASTVFKTVPFGRSGIPPAARLGPPFLHTVEAAERDEHFGNRE
jgi:hypothetical protein